MSDSMCVACEIILLSVSNLRFMHKFYAYFNVHIFNLGNISHVFGHIIFILRLNKNGIPITYGIRFLFSLSLFLAVFFLFIFCYFVFSFLFRFWFQCASICALLLNGKWQPSKHSERRKEKRMTSFQFIVFTIHNIIFSTIRSLPLFRDDEFSFLFCVQSIYSCILFHSDYCGRVVMGKWVDGWMDVVGCCSCCFLFFQIFI